MAKKRTINEYRQTKEYGYVNPEKENEITQIQNRSNHVQDGPKDGSKDSRKKEKKDPQSIMQIMAEVGAQVLLLRRMYPNNQEFGARVAELVNKKEKQIRGTESNL